MINEEANTSDRSSEFCPIQAFFPLIRPILDYKQKTPRMWGFLSNTISGIIKSLINADRLRILFLY